MSATTVWRASVLTLFPEMFPGPLGVSLAGRALREGRWALDAIDMRGYATDRHRSVDDAPFGGGAGMVLRPDVIDAACTAAIGAGAPGRPLICLTPRGRPLQQNLIRGLAQGPGVILLCGRYEGIDQRVIDAHAMLEISIGDYVLSGGEPAALVVIDACVRLLPGVMGAGDASAAEESHACAGLLEYPHYTRPAVWRGRDVPPVLLSGHHEAVARWRREESERATRERRPDLWARLERTSRGQAATGTKEAPGQSATQEVGTGGIADVPSPPAVRALAMDEGIAAA
jgi:tRNA (guanine37-N1)-methyltransferase